MSAPQQISLAMAATPMIRQRRILTLRRLMSLLLMYNNATMRYQVRDYGTFQSLVMARYPDPHMPPDRLQWFYDWLSYGFDHRWSIEQINDSMIRYRNINNVPPTPAVALAPPPSAGSMQMSQSIQFQQSAPDFLMPPPGQPSPPFNFNGVRHSAAAFQSHHGLSGGNLTAGGAIVQAGVNAPHRPAASNDLHSHFFMPHHQVLRSNASLNNHNLYVINAEVSTSHDSNRDRAPTGLSPALEQHRAPQPSTTSADLHGSTNEAQIMQASDPNAPENSFQFDESIDWNDPAFLNGFSGVFEDNTFVGAGGDLPTLDGRPTSFDS